MTCKHNWQYVDGIGEWTDDYFDFVEDIYYCPLCKTFLHVPALTPEDKIKDYEEVDDDENLELHN